MNFVLSRPVSRPHFPFLSYMLYDEKAGEVNRLLGLD